MAKAALVKDSSLHPLSLLDRLTKDFVQEDFILTDQYGNLDLLQSRMHALSQGAAVGSLPVFVLYAGGDCSFINTLKENSRLLETLSPGEKDKSLGVFKQVVLEGILGQNPQEQSENVTYTEDLAAALKDVEDGKYSLVFILND
ncbi:MAG: hypothetical protein ACOY35_05810 [Bacillota bacterium]